MRYLTLRSAWVASSLVLLGQVIGCASGDNTGTDSGPRIPRDGSGDATGALDAQVIACTADHECDDHDACNGVETCVSEVCTPGTAVDCGDDVVCTTDSCDPGTGECSHAPDDSACATGLVCDRLEDCTTPRECTVDTDCDDGIFCNGVERCDLAFGCRRDEAPSCDDGFSCTDDACDATTDACVSTPNAMHCDDGLVCNGAEACAPTEFTADGEGCIAGAPPTCDDGVACTIDACDEAAGGCTAPPSDAACDDGVFCDGAELCVPTDPMADGMGCIAGAAPACDDTIACTVGRCDAASDACVQDANDAACSDGRLCNGAERCDVTGTTMGSGCVAGAALDCSDGLACTTDGCTEPGMCTHGGSDADGDGYTARGCASGNDCDDLSPRTHPGAAEICDGIDNDCSGTGPAPAGVDDGPGMQCPFGSAPRACTTACGSAGTQPCDGACRLGVCRAPAESCNNCDDDGDGLIDEPGGGSPVQCRAGDVRSCTVPGCGTLGTQTCNTGCDWDRCVATEVCNACDDDGDGTVDDGFSLGGSCTVGVGECARTGTVVCRSDGSGTTCSASAGAPVTELCNGRDDDCDGLNDELFTELGVGCNVGVGACRRPGVFVCRMDGTGTTCSATAGTPGAETCNAVDDDCDGTVDDGADGGACDGTDGDLCAEGVNRCMSGMLVCDDATGTIAETCNMVDDNCNGTTDEGCDCTPGMTRSCYGGPMGTQGVGICRAGTQTCVAGTGGVGSMWGACTGAITPGTETCNGMDDDCDGTNDDGNPGGGAACDGADGDSCNEGTATCSGGTIVCSDMTSTNVETCNGANDDCDAATDEGNPGGGGACDGTDGDLCNEGTLNCSSGTLVCSDMTSTSSEICNGVDDNCNGSTDEGNPGGGAACDGGDTDLCNEGTLTCSGGTLGCSDSSGNSTEVCANGIDDDCDGMTDEMCTVVNDTCGGAIALSGGGSRMDTLVGATAQTTDCGSGVEVFYSVTVTAPSVVYLSTLGAASFDTRISYRGTGCPGTSSQCIDDSCGTLQTHLAQLVGAGTHYFAVHTFYSGTTPGPFGLTYGIYPAASGTNTYITPTPATGTAATYTGSTTGTGRVSGSCRTGTAPENSYFWLQCTSESRSYSANTCTGTNYDSVIHMSFNGASIACDDDGCGYPYSSFGGAAASGAGLVQLFVDGFSSAAGSYSVALTY